VDGRSHVLPALAAHIALRPVLGPLVGVQESIASSPLFASPPSTLGKPQVIAHHLDDECALMARRRAPDRVQRLSDPVERVSAPIVMSVPRHVVVDRSRQTHQPQGADARLRSPPLLHRPRPAWHRIGPLLSEQVRRGQATVATDHDRASIPRSSSLRTALRRPFLACETRCTARCQNYRATAVKDPCDVCGRHAPNGLAPVNQTLIPVVDHPASTPRNNAVRTTALTAGVHSAGVPPLVSTAMLDGALAMWVMEFSKSGLGK